MEHIALWDTYSRQCALMYNVQFGKFSYRYSMHIYNFNCVHGMHIIVHSVSMLFKRNRFIICIFNTALMENNKKTTSVLHMNIQTH